MKLRTNSNAGCGKPATAGYLHLRIISEDQAPQDDILNTIRYGMSNARIEATNNKIKLIIRKAYGFRNIKICLIWCTLYARYTHSTS